jgi:hypothetical protein
MTIIQGLIASISTGGGGTPPPTPAEFFWSGDNDSWYAFGGTGANSVYSDPAPANPSYTYRDGSYTGKTRNFTGTEWMISTNIGYGNAWQTNAIAINLWFWPTANNVVVLNEMNVQNALLNDFHYSVLEIDNFVYIRARFWNGNGSQSFISTNTVTLHQWNHIYFAEEVNGNHTFELNGVATTGLPTYIRVGPGSTTEYFGIGVADNTSMVTSNAFQGKVGYLSIADYFIGSTYSSTVNRFRPAVINTTLSLGYSWTVEIIAEVAPTQFWATLWGNEIYDTASGHFAYFNSTTNLAVGSPLGVNNYTVANIGSRTHWAFTHENGMGISVYKNGVLVTPDSTGYVQPLPAGNILLIGARHQNNGIGTNDPCPGTYFYHNINNSTALDATAIQTSYNSLKTTYGLP